MYKAKSVNQVLEDIHSLKPEYRRVGVYLIFEFLSAKPSINSMQEYLLDEEDMELYNKLIEDINKGKYENY